jgi:hypothetical protein
MQIIQNIATIDLPVNPADKHIDFNLNRLYGKKINAIFFSVGWSHIYNPDDPDYVADSNSINYLTINEIKGLSLFLNLIDISGNEFVKNLSIENLLMDLSTPAFCELKLDRVLDLEKSGIQYKADSTYTETKYLKMYFLYQEENFRTFSDEINGSITFLGDAVETDNLYSIVGNKLAGKKIKRIRTNLNGSLNLIGEKNFIDNIVTGFLPDYEITDVKSFWFDLIEFDYKKSSFKQLMDYCRPFYITFIY